MRKNMSLPDDDTEINTYSSNEKHITSLDMITIGTLFVFLFIGIVFLLNYV